MILCINCRKKARVVNSVCKDCAIDTRNKHAIKSFTKLHRLGGYKHRSHRTKKGRGNIFNRKQNYKRKHKMDKIKFFLNNIVDFYKLSQDYISTLKGKKVSNYMNYLYFFKSLYRTSRVLSEKE